MIGEKHAAFQAWMATQGGNIDQANYEAWSAGWQASAELQKAEDAATGTETNSSSASAPPGGSGGTGDVASSEIRDNDDNIGYLIVATIANNLGQHPWEDEWRQFYDPAKWLGSHRAAAAFLTEKMRLREPVSLAVGARAMEGMGDHPEWEPQQGTVNSARSCAKAWGTMICFSSFSLAFTRMIMLKPIIVYGVPHGTHHVPCGN